MAFRRAVGIPVRQQPGPCAGWYAGATSAANEPNMSATIELLLYLLPSRQLFTIITSSRLQDGDTRHPEAATGAGPTGVLAAHND